MSGSSETRSAEVVLPAHLHARPAGALVKTAARFASTVDVSYGDTTVNARSVLGLMSLGALAGSTVVVRATGPDAADAVKAIVEVLSASE
jgi:phosphotransferase system HPr (HPr) family protein